MTISIAEIASKVLARLNADTGTGGLFEVGSAGALVSAVWWDQVPSTAVLPYIAFDVALERASGEAFKANGVAASVRIAVVAERFALGWNPSIPGPDRAAAALARIYGDSGAMSGAPSFGFHRWLMSGLTGWTANPMRFVGQTSEGDENRVLFISEFEIDAITQSW